MGDPVDPWPAFSALLWKMTLKTGWYIAVIAGHLRTDLRVLLVLGGAVILGFVHILLLKAGGAAALMESRAFSRAEPRGSNASICWGCCWGWIGLSLMVSCNVREHTLNLPLFWTPFCLPDMLVLLRNLSRIARTLVSGYAVVVREDTRVRWKTHETKRFQVWFWWGNEVWETKQEWKWEIPKRHTLL